MRMWNKLAAALAAAAFMSGGGVRSHADGKPAIVAARPPVDVKPLGGEVNRGLDWLAQHQLDNGAWGQGDEAATMGPASGLRDTPSVADTAMAVLAFMRAGHTAAHGQHSARVKRGLEYILSEIEGSDDDSLYVTQTRGTRVQFKIGTYVDTFAALMVLTEAKGTMPDENGNKRLERALTKVVAKVQKNQRKDGTWDNKGWAPALTQSMAAKGLNRAKQTGAKVDDATLARIEAQAQSGFDAKSGDFSTSSSAGVGLYGAAAGASAMRESANTRQLQEKELRDKVASAKTAPEREQAAAELRENQQAQGAADAAGKALLGRLDDPSFIRGFGNNGGEEFLSYMLISESLVGKGGNEWKKWDAAIGKLIAGVQNQDGSWTGHHCITGRTFCTAAALLVLMADRAPVPVAGGLRG
jgi:hypothetical protein